MMDRRCSAAPRCAHVPSQKGSKPRFQVRLADGFVCYVTDSERRAEDVAARHEGAAVEPAK